MAKKTILVLVIDNRRACAATLQKIFTEFGCMIKTRLGIHDGVADRCSDQALMILELVGESRQNKSFEKKLKEVEGVKVKSVEL